MQGACEEKIQAQKQWNNTPCGMGSYLQNEEIGSLAFFEKVRTSRYQLTDPWMLRAIDFEAAAGKKVLEIGFGMGTDLLSFCQAGAETYGIDITQKHFELTRKNFELHQKNAVLKLCDAAAIDFSDNYFDVVYSQGVLHHTPDTVRCISEADRVLKPGGLLILGMYYKYSAFHIFSKLLVQGILKGKLFSLGYSGLMATIEHGADGVEIKPLVKTYSKRELKVILADFKQLRFGIFHLVPEHFSRPLGILIPKRLTRLVERFLGWYLVCYATK